MKKLISLMIVICIVLSCAAAAASAEEKEDYSSLFFEHMKDYVEMNEYHQGLVKSSYKLLGETSNGYHIAYCKYYYGDNYDIDFGEYQDCKIGDYIIMGDGYPNKPSGFGIYCFNKDKCLTLENALKDKTVAFEEAARILNEDLRIPGVRPNDFPRLYIYHRGDEIMLGSSFEEALVRTLFGEHIGSYDMSCRVLGSCNENIIFFGAMNDCSAAFTSRRIDDYVIIANSIFSPYDIGIHVFNGKKFYTLDEAISAGLFPMEVVSLMVGAKPVGDANLDGELDMTDVTKLQRSLAGLDEESFLADYIKRVVDLDENGVVDMYDVVLVQRLIAKL